VDERKIRRDAGNARASTGQQAPRHLIEEFVKRPRAPFHRPQQLAELTERELDVLRQIARGRSKTPRSPKP